MRGRHDRVTRRDRLIALGRIVDSLHEDHAGIIQPINVDGYDSASTLLDAIRTAAHEALDG